MELHDILFDLNAGSVIERISMFAIPSSSSSEERLLRAGKLWLWMAHYALRVKEIVSPLERIESLRK